MYLATWINRDRLVISLDFSLKIKSETHYPYIKIVSVNYIFPMTFDVIYHIIVV